MQDKKVKAARDGHVIDAAVDEYAAAAVLCEACGDVLKNRWGPVSAPRTCPKRTGETAAEQPPMDADQREARARELYGRLCKAQKRAAPASWETLGPGGREHYRTLVDVIDEIERERRPLHVLTVSPDGSQSVAPLTVEECRAIAVTDAEEKAFRAGVEVGRGMKGTVMLNGGEQTEGLGPEPGILAPRVTDLARAHLRPEPSLYERTLRVVQAGPPIDYIEDEATAQIVGDGDWRPTVGARVRTVEKLTATRFSPDDRKANASGVIAHEMAVEDGWWVRHDDGTEAPYDADELRPEPDLLGVLRESRAAAEQAGESVDVQAMLAELDAPTDRPDHEAQYLLGKGWIHHPMGVAATEERSAWPEGVWEDVTDPDRDTISGGPSRWDHEHAMAEQRRRDGKIGAS